MKKIYSVWIAFLLFLAAGCSNEEFTERPPTRTVLVYMVESNLRISLQTNINDMIAAATKQNLNGGKLVVFYSENKEKAELFEIKVENETAVTHPVRNYIGKSAVSPETMREVIDEVVSLYPADSYGMILSSHATAWMPGDYLNMLRSFGEEEKKKMEINDLAKAIPDGLFDFLVFDACSMGSIECVYELRNKADFILASPSETQRAGIPYRTVLPYFFTHTANLEKVAEGFYQYYKNTFGNISLVNTQYLGELANITHDIITHAGEENLYFLPYGDLQILSYFAGAPTPLYDFEDVISRLANEEQYRRFKDYLEKTVTNRYYTDMLYCGTQPADGEIYYEVSRFSGLSFYPFKKNLLQLNNWHKNNLEWHKAVYE